MAIVKPQPTPNNLVQDQAKNTQLRYSYDAAGNIQKNAGTQDYVKQAPTGYRYAADGKSLLRTFDQGLAKSIETNTGKTLQELGQQGPIYTQKNIGVTDAEYKKILDANQANAVIKRNMAATMETPGVSQEARNTALQGLRSQLTTNTPGYTAQIAANAAANTTATPSAALVAKRSETLASSAPTPTNPMVPVGATGARTPVSTAPTPYTPVLSRGAAEAAYNKPSAMAGGGMLGAPATTQGSMFNLQPEGQMFTEEDYLNATPEQQAQMRQMAFQQQAQMQAGNLQNLFGAQDQMFATRQNEAQAALDAEKAQLEAQKAKEEADFLAAQEAAKAQAVQAVQKASAQRQEQLNRSMAFQGFGRSSVAVDAGQSISADTQAQIADIERQSSAAINQFKASALEKFNNRISDLQSKVDKFGDARDELELKKIAAQGELMMDLFKQNPSSPENMIKTAEKLKAERIEQQRLAAAEQKEIRAAAKDNLEFMLGEFGSQYLSSMSPEDMQTLAHNVGVPASVLAKLGKTQQELDRDWEQMKYIQDQEFDLAKIQANQDFSMFMADRGFKQDLQKMGIQFNNELAKENFKDQLSAQKYANLGYGSYANDATGIVNNGAGLILNSGAQVSPQLKNAAVPGSKKAAGPTGLGGQCAYEAGGMVNKPGSNERMVYGMNINDKKKTLANYVNQGKAFFGGNGQAKVGNSVITNESAKWGHVAVINEITPDGKYVLTEYNRTGPLQFSNSRVVDPNNPMILGVIDTQPNKNYQVAKDIQSLTKDVVKKDPLVKAGADVLGSTAIGKLLGVIPKALDAEMARQKLAASDYIPNQAMDAEFEAGTVDETGRPIDATRAAVRSGNYELGKDELSYLRQNNPQAFNEYLSDLTFAKQSAKKTGAGGKQLTDTAVQNLQKFAGIEQSLGTLDDFYKNIQNVGPQEFARGWNPFDTEARQFDALKTSLTGPAARTILQEVGALTDSDLKRVDQLLPSITDTRDVANYKIGQLKELLQKAKQNALDFYGASGYDVAGIRSLPQFSQQSARAPQSTGRDQQAAQILLENGMDASPASVALFLKNNPNF
jgi:hypothetical protein